MTLLRTMAASPCGIRASHLHSAVDKHSVLPLRMGGDTAIFQRILYLLRLLLQPQHKLQIQPLRYPPLIQVRHPFLISLPQIRIRNSSRSLVPKLQCSLPAQTARIMPLGSPYGTLPSRLQLEMMSICQRIPEFLFDSRFLSGLERCISLRLQNSSSERTLTEFSSTFEESMLVAN